MRLGIDVLNIDETERVDTTITTISGPSGEMIEIQTDSLARLNFSGMYQRKQGITIVYVHNINQVQGGLIEVHMSLFDVGHKKLTLIL